MLPSKDREKEEWQEEKDICTKHVLSIYYPDTTMPLRVYISDQYGHNPCLSIHLAHHIYSV